MEDDFWDDFLNKWSASDELYYDPEKDGFTIKSDADEETSVSQRKWEEMRVKFSEEETKKIEDSLAREYTKHLTGWSSQIWKPGDVYSPSSTTSCYESDTPVVYAKPGGSLLEVKMSSKAEEFEFEDRESLGLGPVIFTAPNYSAQHGLVDFYGWGCFQTFVGDPHVMEIDPATVRCQESEDGTWPLGSAQWFAHASYKAKVAPDNTERREILNYLYNVLDWAHYQNISGVVVHTGETYAKPRPISNILDCAEILFRSQCEWDDIRARILWENSASEKVDFPFMERRAELTAEFGHGWCLDTHHAWASGYPIGEFNKFLGLKPTLIHGNFFGSENGSFRDVHGWLYKTWDKGVDPDSQTTVSDRKAFIVFLRDAVHLGIPIILEGGHTCQGEIFEEVAFLQIAICHTYDIACKVARTAEENHESIYKSYERIYQNTFRFAPRTTE